MVTHPAPGVEGGNSRCYCPALYINLGGGLFKGGEEDMLHTFINKDTLEKEEKDREADMERIHGTLVRIEDRYAAHAE